MFQTFSESNFVDIFFEAHIKFCYNNLYEIDLNFRCMFVCNSELNHTDYF